jgi:hypothetical protein
VENIAIKKTLLIFLSYIVCVTTNKDAVTGAGNCQLSISDYSDHPFSKSAPNL